MMQNRMFSLLAMVVGLGTVSWGQMELAGQRYAVTTAEGQVCLFPYRSSHDLEATNENVERLIYSIHSSVYDAMLYYDNAAMAISRGGEDPEKNLIIAPHFLNRQTIQQEISRQMPMDTLYWREYPYWGTSEGVYNGRSVTISAYDVADQMLEGIVRSGRFPNLKSIVILGHSAGGQMVNRYAAGSRFEFDTAQPAGIEVRYLVMAPSTCVYFTPERWVKGTADEFRMPGRAPSDFNSWGYGIDRLFPYHERRGVTPEWIREHYPRRKVLYLVGEQDVDPNDDSLATSAGAMLMGKNRLERAGVYMNYLRHLYGSSVTQTQRFESVPRAGHSGRQLMTSRAGLAFIFGRDAATGGAVASADEASAQ